MPQPFVITGNVEFQGDPPINSDLECDLSNWNTYNLNVQGIEGEGDRIL